MTFNVSEELFVRDPRPARITVTIPSYNAADTLERAVRSALGQSAGGVEIHVIDDASTDRSWELIRKLWQEADNIRATRFAENRGRSVAGNYGFTHAAGKWVAILDADDWYEPERLEKIVAATEAADVEMGSDNQIFFDATAHMVVGTAFQVGGGAKILDLDAFQDGSDATKNFDYGMLKPVFLKEFLARHDLQYYAPARRGQDYYILLSFFAAGGRAIVLDEPLYNYVQPFGLLSRQWSTTSRQPYPFEAMQRTNDHFYEVFRTEFTARQRRRLAARGKQFALLAGIDRVRTARHAGNNSVIVKTLIGGFPGLWCGLAKQWFRNWRRRRLVGSAPIKIDERNSSHAPSGCANGSIGAFDGP